MGGPALIEVAAGVVNQTPLDWDRNIANVRRAIALARDAGASLLIESDVPHEVEALEDSVVLDVFAPRREDWIRGDDAYLRG